MSLLLRLLVALALLGMCIRARVLQTRGVSDEDKKAILEAHNAYRRGVSPTATNMRKMYWSDDLERAAKTWVDKCIAGHDDSYERRKSANIGAQVGQNQAKAYSWAQSIQLWHDEVQYFDYDNQATNTSGKAVGHYTQVVWYQSSIVGCAMANCEEKQYYICNYAYGNMNGQKNYKEGASCADCQSKCDDKLCDCNGKICKNGGSMNLNDCSCTCSHGFTGDSCEICPWEDRSHACGADFPPSHCAPYANVPEVCPVMCGFCPDTCPGKDYNSCKNGGTLKEDCTCMCNPLYTGEFCETVASCSDAGYCGNEYPYGWPKSYCTVYTNVPKECPKMCGKC